MTKKHPMQPIVWKDKVARFKENKIVVYLLDHGSISLNDLAILDFNDDDRQQFAQLIGYSVSGFGDLSYASPKIVETADKIAARMPT